MKVNDYYKTLSVYQTHSTIIDREFSSFINLRSIGACQQSGDLASSFRRTYGDDLYEEMRKDLLNYWYFSNTPGIDKNTGMLYFLNTQSFSTRDTFSQINKRINSENDSSTQSIFSNSYPNAVRWTNGVGDYIIERPPFQTTVSFKSGRANSTKNAKNYTIWVPWTVTYLSIDPKRSSYKVKLFLNDGPLTSLDDTVIHPFYYNLYGDATLCLSESYQMLQSYVNNNSAFDISSIYNFIINDYFSGGWNLDLGMNPGSVSLNTEISKIYYNCKKPKWALEQGYIKKIPASGRISMQAHNEIYLKHLSTLSLQQMLEYVTDYKSKFTFDLDSNTDRNYGCTSVSHILNKVEFQGNYSADQIHMQEFFARHCYGYVSTFQMLTFTSEAMNFINNHYSHYPDLSINDFVKQNLIDPLYLLIRSKYYSQYSALLQVSKDDAITYNYHYITEKESPLTYVEVGYDDSISNFTFTLKDISEYKYSDIVKILQPTQ